MAGGDQRVLRRQRDTMAQGGKGHIYCHYDDRYIPAKTTSQAKQQSAPLQYPDIGEWLPGALGWTTRTPGSDQSAGGGTLRARAAARAHAEAKPD
jgi:hypothetical protein